MVIGKGTVVRDSIIMKNSQIGENCIVDKAIIAEAVEIGDHVELGIGEFAPNVLNPKVYAFDLVTIAEHSVIPPNVSVGKNTAIVGETVPGIIRMACWQADNL